MSQINEPRLGPLSHLEGFAYVAGFCLGVQSLVHWITILKISIVELFTWKVLLELRDMDCKVNAVVGGNFSP